MLFYGWMGEKGRGPLDPGPIRSASSEKEGEKARRESAKKREPVRTSIFQGRTGGWSFRRWAFRWRCR